MPPDSTPDQTAEQDREAGRKRAGNKNAEQDREAGRKRAGKKNSIRPSREETERAIRTLIRGSGDDPDREGLADTPGRVVRAWEEFCAGYAQDPAEMMAPTIDEIADYY